MDDLIVDDKLLAEFAKAIYTDVEKYLNEHKDDFEINT